MRKHRHCTRLTGQEQRTLRVQASSLRWDGGGQSFGTKHPSVTSVNYLDKLKDESEGKRVSYLNNPSLI